MAGLTGSTRTEADPRVRWPWRRSAGVGWRRREGVVLDAASALGRVSFRPDRQCDLDDVGSNRVDVSIEASFDPVDARLEFGHIASKEPKAINAQECQYRSDSHNNDPLHLGQL